MIYSLREGFIVNGYEEFMRGGGKGRASDRHSHLKTEKRKNIQKKKIEIDIAKQNRRRARPTYSPYSQFSLSLLLILPIENLYDNHHANHDSFPPFTGLLVRPMFLYQMVSQRPPRTRE